MIIINKIKIWIRKILNLHLNKMIILKMLNLHLNKMIILKINKKTIQIQRKTNNKSKIILMINH